MNDLNLRASSKDQAALVLQHAGNSINMKVQFNPGDYHSMLTLASSHEDERVNDHEHDDHEDSSEESESEDDEHDEVMSSSHRHSIRAANPNNPKQEKSRSGSPTPRNR